LSSQLVITLPLLFLNFVRNINGNNKNIVKTLKNS